MRIMREVSRLKQKVNEKTKHMKKVADVDIQKGFWNMFPGKKLAVAKGDAKDAPAEVPDESNSAAVPATSKDLGLAPHSVLEELKREEVEEKDKTPLSPSERAHTLRHSLREMYQQLGQSREKASSLENLQVPTVDNPFVPNKFPDLKITRGAPVDKDTLSQHLKDTRGTPVDKDTLSQPVNNREISPVECTDEPFSTFLLGPTVHPEKERKHVTGLGSKDGGTARPKSGSSGKKTTSSKKSGRAGSGHKVKGHGDSNQSSARFLDSGKLQLHTLLKIDWFWGGGWG
jgi:hypothetical protein